MKRRQNQSRPSRGFFGSTAFTRRGASIIEVLISVTIVVISAMAAASFFANQAGGARNSRQRAACMAALDAQISYFRTMPNGTAYQWEDPTTLATTPIATNQTWFSDALIKAPVAALEVTPANPGGGRFYRPWVLQQGSMGVLGKLMHYQPGICAGPIDFTSIAHNGAQPLPAAYNDELLTNFRSTIQIRPYDLIAGTQNAATACNMWARAQGSNDLALSAATPSIVNFEADTSKDIGYRLKLTGTYDTPNGPATCSASEDFSFPVDRKDPKISAVLNLYDTSIEPDVNHRVAAMEPEMAMYPPKTRTCSAGLGHAYGATPAQLDLHIGFSPSTTMGKIEPGTVFLCRDISVQMNIDPKTHDYCHNAAGAAMKGNNFPADFPPAEWVPCSQVTACGLPPSNTSFTQTASGQQKYVNEYRWPYTGSAPLPAATAPDGIWGCDVKIDVATVDPGGNFKLLSATTGRIPGKMADTTGYYYQPAECWACYKKKSSLFAIALGIIAIATVVFAYAGIAAVVACAAGGGGLCTPKHTKFIGNECYNRYGSGGSKFCTKVKTNFPSWFGSGVTTTTCPAQGPTPYPGNPTMFYSLEQREAGESYEDEAQYDAPTGAYCQAQAQCVQISPTVAQWQGFPDEYDNPTPIAECGKYYTAHKLDISATPVGSPPPTSGPAVCRFYVPDQYAARVGWVASNYYSSFTKCDSSMTGLGYDALCQYYWSGYYPYVWFPTDPMTNVYPNTDPNRYFYFNYDMPPNLSLPECS